MEHYSEKRYQKDKHKKRKIITRRFFYLICILYCIIISFYLIKEPLAKENGMEIKNQGKLEAAVPEIESININIDKEKCKLLVQENPELLILVNKENPLPESYKHELRSISNGRLKAAKVTCDALTELLKAGHDAGYSFWIASAYRSKDKQQTLVNEDVNAFMNQGMTYEEALAETYKDVMPPGCSEHETGLAVDILASDNMNMDTSQAKSPGNKWLRENCDKYGFILRYPKEKENITKVDYEPWHFRYVGKGAAKYIMENNLTLEEFYLFADLSGSGKYTP
jgi:D-alanyl-D-alanine carboxypeptidase